MTRFAPRLKLALHPQFASYMAGEFVAPINVEISPCGVCNATCPGCPHVEGACGPHRNVMLEYEQLAQLLYDASNIGVKSVSWTGGGEPSLYPNIESAVIWAVCRGLKQGMFTNALLPPKYDPALLDWIRVTMTDRPYRPDCIKPLRAAKSLGFAFNYSGPDDIPYLWDTLHLAEDVQADYVQCRPRLKQGGLTVDIEPPPIVHPLLECTAYKFSEAKKRHGYSRCEAFHLMPMIWEDGNVDVCAYNRLTPGYTLGNLYERSFVEIMRDAPAWVPVHDGCQVCCRPHESNLAIQEARQLTDVDFP